jgi:hypothetical protein
MARWYLERKAKDEGFSRTTQSDYDPDAVRKFLAAIGPNLPVLRAIEAALDEMDR